VKAEYNKRQRLVAAEAQLRKCGRTIKENERTMRSIDENKRLFKDR
jgi:hypothetical protein